MRFLKKASISELEQFMDTFKDFELFLTAEDITDGNMNDGLEKIESLIKKEDICISAVHCPKHRENINYLSVCEIAADEFSQKIFHLCGWIFLLIALVFFGRGIIMPFDEVICS